MSILTGLSLLLIIGIVGSIIASKVRVSNILILVLIGMLIGNLGFTTCPEPAEVPVECSSPFLFPPTLMVSLAILTLAMVVFDGSSRFRLEELDLQSNTALVMVVVYVLINLVLLGTAVALFFLDFSLAGLVLAAIFAVVMAGTDPGSVFILLGDTKHRTLDFLKLEAILNTPPIVIIPFLLLRFLEDVQALTVASTFIEFVGPLVQQVVVGVGAGIMVGIIVFRLMRKYYSEKLSPVVLLATTILTYVIAENMGGNGVLGVATLGLLFGNTYVKEKGSLIEFSKLLAMSLEILVFLLIGLLVQLDFSLWFFVKSLLVFGVAVGARYLAVLFTLRRSEFKVREKVFLALNMPKGIAVAVVTLTFYVLMAGLTGYEAQVESLLTLMILFVVYSLVLGSVVDRFGEYFIQKPIASGEQGTEWTEEKKETDVVGEATRGS